MELYLRHLNPGGVLLMHLSNRALNLRPVLSRVVAESGVVGRIEDFHPSEAEMKAMVAPSRWAVVARDRQSVAALTTDERWEELATDGGRGWSDDFSSLVEALQFGNRK
jgi:hypothetical protein